MRSPSRITLIVTVSAVLLTGCETPRAPSAAPASRPNPASSYNLSGYPTAFKEGYGDACASPQRRNAERLKSDTDYSMGWNDGQSVCRGR